MKKLNKNQKGFSVTELLLIIVVVIIVGAVGLLVYRHSRKPAPTPSATTQRVANPNTVTTYTTWASLPTTVQSALTSLQSSCTETQLQGQFSDGSLQVQTEHNDTFVVFGTSCHGATLLYLGAYVNGSWKLVASGPGEGGGGEYCSALKQYNVPVNLLVKSNYGLGAENSQGQSTTTYQCFTDSYGDTELYNGPA